jgi:hypothetical protein
MVVMSDNHYPALAKLDSTNYMVWRTRMEDHLVGKDLLDAISPGFLAGTPSPEDLRKDSKAFSLLRTYVGPSMVCFNGFQQGTPSLYLLLCK